MANPIATENLNTGSTGWSVTNYGPTFLAAYTDKTSYNPGDTVNFYNSVQVAATSYTINIYRAGWYNGAGGCLKATITNSSGTAQGWFNSGTNTVTNCPTAISDASTHNWEAGWAITDTWVIPGNAVTGVYIAVFTDANTHQGAIYFVVKGNTSADYTYITPVLTDQAYNTWGSGYSLYTNATVGVKVSFNRPYYAGYGCGTLYQHQIQLIHWLESQNYNLSYLSNIDVHVNVAQLTNYKAMLFAAHDEYWTKAMRDGVEAALAAGVAIGNMGANNCYWQCRLGPDNASSANRSMTCYKVQSFNSNISLDPNYNVDNTTITTNWRDPVLKRPESTLWGIMWSSDQNWPGNNVAWTVASTAPASLIAGTGLIAGNSYGTDCVGYEWDKKQLGSPDTLLLQIIATSNITDKNAKADTSQSTIYTAASGAQVFSCGSINFAYALDNYRYNAANVAVVPQMQSLMANIMVALIAPIQKQGFSSFAMHR